MSDQTFTPGPWTWFNYPDGRKLLAQLARKRIGNVAPLLAEEIA